MTCFIWQATWRTCRRVGWTACDERSLAAMVKTKAKRGFMPKKKVKVKSGVKKKTSGKPIDAVEQLSMLLEKKAAVEQTVTMEDASKKPKRAKSTKTNRSAVRKARKAKVTKARRKERRKGIN